MRRRRAQPNPMRLLVMLGVMWAAGSLLFAAESSPPARERAQQAAQTQQTQPQPEAQGQATATASAPAPASEAGAPAQPAADDSQEAPEADAAPASTPDRDSEEQQGRDEAGATAKKDSTAAGRAPRRFVPSEQVRADFDVSFPIDI